ncbi:hypothetical protein [Polaribacter aquimarinus]|uniref:Uncharacterized protein n=1 Tax=Polaribacter aquimarinus TaxID=2100726 RepID=A0A2U2J702_9FLAO|nr:hypothetical protein [Polaribacter aquimarinus]PWG04110.1 hypothetical protein DIS07_14170 [Polaribacter aquimarinus]
MKYLHTSTEIERGILTSSYKKEIKNQSKIEKFKSLSKMKSMIFNHQERFESQAGTILRVSFFMLAIIFMVA